MPRYTTAALDWASSALNRPSGTQPTIIDAAKQAINTARAAVNAEGNPDAAAGARAAAAYSVGLVANIAGIGGLDTTGVADAFTACVSIRALSGTQSYTGWCDKLR